MRKILSGVYLPLIVAYLSMSYIYPTDPGTIASRHLTITQARFLALTFAVIFIAIWLFAIYGSYRLKKYSISIKQDEDGAAFMKLANGLILLSVFYPVRSVAKICLNYLAHVHPSLTTTTNVIITYVSLIIPLVAYTIISRAAHRLYELAKARVTLRTVYLLILVYILIGAMFSYVSYSTANKLTPSNWLITTNYNLPVPLRILTIVVPYLFMWFIGLGAAMQISLYQRHVKGIFYRKSMRLLSAGITLALVSSIVAQITASLAADIRSMPTAVMIIIVYSILAILAAAFVMISRGVKRLRQLDEI